MPSRVAPVKIESIAKDGIRFENTLEDPNNVVARDAKSGAVKWKAHVLNYWSDPKAPIRPFAVYFKSMKLTNEDTALLIEDERTVRYTVDLKTKKVSILDWSVALQHVASKPTEQGWKYRVRLTLQNTLNRVMKLDEPSVGYGGKPGAPGELSNQLFQVMVDGKEVRYQGPLRRRAPPSEFIELKPGEIYSVDLELGQEYPVPSGAHDVVVTFEHTNHFSPDGFRMRSAALKFRLEGEAWELKDRPPAP